jgi:putative selenate reductase molybdopterin-binding subunit
MEITLNINGRSQTITAHPTDTLLSALRGAGYFSVRFGSDDGATGAAAVLVDGRLVNSDIMLAGQAVGRRIETVEGLTDRVGDLHPIQKAFIETGAIQSGYSTPAMILAAKALLDKNPDPSEAEIRDALSGVLCRETGYLKPVEAILRAAAYLRGENPPPYDGPEIVPAGYFVETPPDGEDSGKWEVGSEMWDVETQVKPRTDVWRETKPQELAVVGKPEAKVDGVKLAKGNPAFVDDIEMRGMLHAKLLTSPHAHARIRDIDDREALALPGVHAVLHYKNVPRVKYASGGQSYPNPPPYDQVSFDNKVRYVGDRVAVVAAESVEIAEQALKLIQVDYEILPAVFDENEAMKPGAPIIHDEEDTDKIHDRARNVVHHIHAEVGSVEQGFAEAAHVFEHTYYVHQVQQVPIEPHIAISWWDADERLIIRTSTQVPFHVRRMVAPLLGLPVSRIRVIKPRIGGGFRRQAGDAAGGYCRPFDHRHRPSRPPGIDPLRRVPQQPHPPPANHHLQNGRHGRRQTAQHDYARHRQHRRLRHARPHRANRHRPARPQQLQLRPSQIRLPRCLHQFARTRRLSGLRRAASPVRPGMPHGRNRPRPRPRPHRIPAQKLGAGRRHDAHRPAPGRRGKGDRPF